MALKCARQLPERISGSKNVLSAMFATSQSYQSEWKNMRYDKPTEFAVENWRTSCHL